MIKMYAELYDKMCRSSAELAADLPSRTEPRYVAAKHRDPVPEMSAEGREAAAIAKDREKFEQKLSDVTTRMRLELPSPGFADSDDGYEWEQRWQNIKWMAQALAEPGRGISPAVKAAVAEFDADLEAYWRAHPELDHEPVPEPEPKPELEPALEPVPEPSAFVQSLVAATRGRLPLEFEPDELPELEMSSLPLEAAS